MHLYELAAEYNTVLDTEDMTDEQIVEHLDNIRAEFKDKVINTGKVVLTLRASARATKDEANRLIARQKSLEHKAEWLEGYLLDSLQEANVAKVEGDVLRVSLKNNPPSVKVIDENLIPQEFRKVIPESWQPMKGEILKHFASSGELIPGVEIVTDKRSVVIK